MYRVIALDTFEAAHDPKEAEYVICSAVDEETAQQFAMTRLVSLEETQPTSESGGQWPWGIQDRVFIERPDGTRYRVLPPDLAPILKLVTDSHPHDKDGVNFEMECGHEVWTPTNAPKVGEWAFCSQCLQEWFERMKAKAEEKR